MEDGGARRMVARVSVLASVATAQIPESDPVDSLDFRSRPFCAHAEPIVATIPGEEPAYVIACPECGATAPKQLPGVPVDVATDA